MLKFKTNFRPVIKMTGMFSWGFTLIELIVVVAIIGILLSIAMPAYFSYIDEARVTRAISEIGLLQREIIEYQDDDGNLPTSLDEIGRGKLLDPWGNPYQYLNFETIDETGKGKDKEKGKKRKDHNLHPINDYFDLYSMGKDGKSQAPLTAKSSRDDIIMANNGRYIGLASDY